MREKTLPSWVRADHTSPWLLGGCVFVLLSTSPILAGNSVPAELPTDPSAWTLRPGIGHPPRPAVPMGILYDENTGRWHSMGRKWGDGVELLLYTSQDGLSAWQEAPGNPVIRYDNSIPKRDKDWYVQMPCYGTNRRSGRVGSRSSVSEFSLFFSPVEMGTNYRPVKSHNNTQSGLCTSELRVPRACLHMKGAPFDLDPNTLTQG